MKWHKFPSISHWLPFALIAGFVATGFSQPGCLVEQRCYADADCASPEICLPTGSCGFACSVDADCGPGMTCTVHRCVPKSHGPLTCPSDMVNVANAFCVDKFEASRPDATASSPGADSTSAMSRQGVMPWRLSFDEDNTVARKACQAAGKDLCSPGQWQAACRGPADTTYGYGDTYEPDTCNGIDKFGLSGFHVLPTGTLPGCVSGWGAYDMNGNLWEHTLGGSGKTVRGGAYNCKDSRKLHKCDYVPGTWTPSALGFRCCLTPAEDGSAGSSGAGGSSDASPGRESP